MAASLGEVMGGLFKPGSMDPISQIFNIVPGIIAAIAAIALAIFGSPLFVVACVATFSAMILTGSLMGSPGVIAIGYIFMVSVGIVTSILSPVPASFVVLI
jgi:hypothetical protein